MPHSFPITVVANPTKLSIKPPPMMCDLETSKNENLTRFPVPTPPLSSTSPMVELAPIIDLCDNRPPSPESPKIKRFIVEEQERPVPLEPAVPSVQHNTQIFPVRLFEPLQRPYSFLIPSNIQIPIPQRRSSPPRYDPFFKAIQSSPMSPTMAAASASAAAAAAQRHPGSQVAASLLKAIQPDSKQDTKHIEELETDIALAFTDCYSNGDHVMYKSARNNVDQSMFLTKNAHIKRPRNAWIHVRTLKLLKFIYSSVCVVSMSLWTSTQDSGPYFTC
ncbi:unnamed protein product [Rhizopus microsporus]